MSTIGFDYDHLRESIKSIQDVTQKLSENFSNTTIQLDEYKKSYSNLVADLQKTISQHAEFQKSEQIKVQKFSLILKKNRLKKNFKLSITVFWT